MNPYPSPLRYPGGKRAIANYIKLLIGLNDLRGGDYIEVYAGGANIALSLLYDGIVSNVHLNDFNQQVFLFWQAVLTDTERLCQLIRDTPVSVKVWHEQKAIYQQPHEFEPVLVAFAFFFLNRTNRSGILNGGIIGGLDQTGEYPIDARYNPDGLIERIQMMARYKEQIHLYNQDAEDFIRSTLTGLTDRSLVYLDPPYYVKGKKLYDNYYAHSDHEAIRDLVRTAIGQQWVISYDNVEPIAALYKEFKSITYGLRYSLGDKYEGSEVMFFSSSLQIPPDLSPAYIDKKQLEKLLAPQQLPMNLDT